jgi:hypothetical protein
MLEFFANPGFLAVAGVLISAPIIIHLINRMRFKRIRWAAMEFLLKAQKRMRKRLIIEQLLLLMLRCLLVALAGLLVCRFVGFAGSEYWSRPNMHIVVLDDTLSMHDQWKKEDAALDCFKMAKEEFLHDRIAKAVARSTPNDRLAVVRLSEVAADADFQPKIYDHLNDPVRFKELESDIAEMEATKLHVAMLQAIKKVQEIVANNSDAVVTLHLLSDFRQKDWSLPRAEELYKSLVVMGKTYKDMKIHLYDAAEKPRESGQSGFPPSHDNVGIVELRPSTRIVGKGMPVNFSMTVANYGSSQAELGLRVDEIVAGQEPKEQFEVAQVISPPLPIVVPAGERTTVTFDLRFTPTIRAGETYFAQIAARLVTHPGRGELPNDGLRQDNFRYAAVEVRDRVPVLLIDGLGAKGREENHDSYHIFTGLFSVPSNRRDAGAYEVVYGDQIAGGVAAKALERPDLRKYPSIFIMNVAELSPKQITGLETYVKEGGGVAFFMGPQVNAAAYNKNLYRNGEGVFPVPLKESYFPPPGQDTLPETFGDTPRILLRDDQYKELGTYPIFGPAEFNNALAKQLLGGLSINRYFQVPRAEWHPDPSRVYELATLPNDEEITRYQKDVYEITRGAATKELLASDDYAKYRSGLEAHFAAIERLVAPGSDLKAHQLAPALDAMLKDQGKTDAKAESPKANLTEFWSKNDLKIEALRRAVVRLHDEAKYGDAFVIGAQFGKGRVVACMTTAGKEWNNWGGGSAATPLYPGFIWETQNFLSGQGSEANLSVGTPVKVEVDAEQYKQQSAALKLTRAFFQPNEGKPAKAIPSGEREGKEEKKGLLSFHFDKTLEPGLYVSELRYAGDAPTKAPLAVYSHVFNVDTPSEGPLQRVSSDDLDRDLISQLPKDMVTLVTSGSGGGDLATRRTDLSEAPWFFLLLLCILVAEQALAVHLSFHLKGGQNEVLNKVTRPPAAV